MTTIVDELRMLSSGGRLSPEEVVTYAEQNPKSALHQAFASNQLWDDAVAAEVARLAFGRSLIHRYRVKITRVDGEPVRVRALVSLSCERSEGASYRPRQVVMSDAELRQRFIEDCQRDIEALMRRYADIWSVEQLASLQQLFAETLRLVEAA